MTTDVFGAGIDHEGLRIKAWSLGPFQTNCYIVWSGKTSKCFFVDASFGADIMARFAREHGLEPQALLLTHAHLDHIAGVRAVKAAYPKLEVLIHEAEGPWLLDSHLNLSEQAGMPVTAPVADRLLRHADAIELVGATWEVRHTPGHSPGGITLAHAAGSFAFVGDALFSGSIGRTDFPGSDHAALLESIRSRIYTLPAEAVCYCGHGPPTTVARERLSNPFVRG